MGRTTAQEARRRQGGATAHQEACAAKPTAPAWQAGGSSDASQQQAVRKPRQEARGKVRRPRGKRGVGSTRKRKVRAGSIPARFIGSSTARRALAWDPDGVKRSTSSAERRRLTGRLGSLDDRVYLLQHQLGIRSGWPRGPRAGVTATRTYPTEPNGSQQASAQRHGCPMDWPPRMEPAAAGVPWASAAAGSGVPVAAARCATRIEPPRPFPLTSWIP